jgi:hypothetical protein
VPVPVPVGVLLSLLFIPGTTLRAGRRAGDPAGRPS